MHDRKVTRIITPGTLIDESFMDPFANNYVLAIHLEDPYHCALKTIPTSSSTLIGLAWLDLSTGHFFMQTTTFQALPSFLARTGPREIILHKSVQADRENPIFAVLQEENHLISYVDGSVVKPISEWADMLESPIPVHSIDSFTDQEISAGSTLIEYVGTRLQSSNIKLQAPIRHSDVMEIDKSTMRALEIRKTIKEGSLVGSLLHSIRRTNTKGGARLLDSWLSKSSNSLSGKLADFLFSRPIYLLGSDCLSPEPSNASSK
jgi:DNA mismatch repair ATPase MutS